MLTIFPDYMFRRYRQGKRIGHEITLFSVWYELRYGIVTCLMLTISLVTVVFYYHPSTTNVSSFFRTVTILSESGGRVEEVYVINNQEVNAGDPLFSLDASSQRAAVETAERQIEEVLAQFNVAEADLAAARGVVAQAKGALDQAKEELAVRQTLLDQGSTAVNTRDVEKLENVVETRQGALDAAKAQLKAVEAEVEISLPAAKATALASLKQAQTELEKTVIYALVDGTVEQFALQPGDIVNPILRPAGVLVPPDVGEGRFQAGFSQLSAQVIKPGMLAEITCMSLPFTIIPMKVVGVTDYIPSGQFRPSDQLLDVQDRARPGTLNVYMEPLFEGGTKLVSRGSKCIANVYTNNHDRLHSEEMSTGKWLFLHMVDTVGLVHAAILRIQALLLPVQNLVLTGH
ncbi:HlyD family secretion protein [Roseovarius albus]|nr:HlyD family secretion protein [Roseovarius albus]